MDKLLIASDIHGSAYYCEHLCERIAEEKPERIILLGDILYHGPRNDLPRDYDPKKNNRYAEPPQGLFFVRTRQLRHGSRPDGPGFPHNG